LIFRLTTNDKESLSDAGQLGDRALFLKLNPDEKSGKISITGSVYGFDIQGQSNEKS
jgi:hypothetical protein